MKNGHIFDNTSEITSTPAAPVAMRLTTLAVTDQLQ